MRFPAYLHNALEHISSWMTTNLLTLNSSKTEFLFIGLKQKCKKKHSQFLALTEKSAKIFYLKTLNMIFQHAGADFFGNFWHAGLYADLITRVEFQVDWSKGLESTAYRPIRVPKIGCFSASRDRRPYNSVTHYRHGVTHCDMPFLAANELFNCFIT